MAVNLVGEEDAEYKKIISQWMRIENIRITVQSEDALEDIPNKPAYIERMMCRAEEIARAIDADVAAIQAGVFTVDEVRATRGLAPNGTIDSLNV